MNLDQMKLKWSGGGGSILKRKHDTPIEQCMIVNLQGIPISRQSIL